MAYLCYALTVLDERSGTKYPDIQIPNFPR